MPPVTDMASLIARLEQASESSRELDAEIARAMRGAHGDKIDAPEYTDSIDAALLLVPDGAAWSVMQNHISPAASVGGNRVGPWWRRRSTPALALCIAALKARNTRTQEDM